MRRSQQERLAASMCKEGARARAGTPCVLLTAARVSSITRHRAAVLRVMQYEARAARAGEAFRIRVRVVCCCSSNRVRGWGGVRAKSGGEPERTFASRPRFVDYTFCAFLLRAAVFLSRRRLSLESFTTFTKSARIHCGTPYEISCRRGHIASHICRASTYESVSHM